MTKTGSAQGLAIQKKKDNITKEQFRSAFGINPDGTFQKGTSKDGIIRALATQASMITANQALRVDATNKGVESTDVIALLGDGRSDIMFSKITIYYYFNIK